MKSVFKAEPPKKQRIIKAITESIQHGELSPGDCLATVREMSEHFAISSAVVHRALKDLVADGMIECRGGQGFYVKNELEPTVENHKNPTSITMTHPGDAKIFLICGHHSDLTWKWTYDEYERIRSGQWDLICNFFEKYPDFHAFVEQSEAIRPYMEKNPEKAEILKAAAQSGRLSLLGGFCIPDLNMISGELLVRTLQFGREFYQKTFNKEITVSCMDDAFGMSAQLPQVLKKSGYRFLVPGRRPNFPRSLNGNAPFNWRGLDTSSVTVLPANAYVNHIGYTINVPVTYSPDEELKRTLEGIKNTNDASDLFVEYMTEIESLQESLFPILENVNRSGNGRKITFGSIEDYAARINVSGLPEFSGEFNPVFSGCYTTRIEVKKTFRQTENLLISAEMFSALNSEVFDFTPAWRELMLASFHDALCGCHHDAVNHELKNKFDFIKDLSLKAIKSAVKNHDTGYLSVFNPDSASEVKIIEFSPEYGIPDGYETQKYNDKHYFSAELNGCSIKSFKLINKKVKAAGKCNPVFETDFFTVDFSSAYPVIREKHSKKSVFHPEKFGEILFRRDTGTMWSEALSSPYYGAEFTAEKVESIEKGELFTVVKVSGHAVKHPGIDGATEDYWSGFGSLKFEKEYFFYHKLNYFNLKIKLFWQGNNTKISVRFPLQINVLQSNFVCEIPFGAINRKPYFEVENQYAQNILMLNNEDYRHAAGDWPCRTFVDYSDNSSGLALANDGVAGFQGVNGAIYASLLRSGTGIFDGNMQPQPGSFDNGEHEYNFQITPHSIYEISEAAKSGRRLNFPPISFIGKNDCNLPFEINNENLSISNLRKTADGLILRLYENIGRQCQFKFDSEQVEFYESDLTEKNWHKIEADNINFAPFEIKTLKLVPLF